MEQYLATCPEEFKELLMEELASLGAADIRPGFRAVYFQADKATFYKLHLCLSTASNLFKILRECSAQSATILHSQAKRVSWARLFGSNKTYRVDGIAGDRGEQAMSANEISKQVRLAIEHNFSEALKPKPQVDLKEPDLIITAYVYRGRASLCLNTSGKALHKRGYRQAGHPAPLKETIAAAIIRLAKYDGSMPLLDPMCGSGTIVIEAAYKALHKACNIHRKKGQFALEHLADFDKNLWRQTQEQMRNERLSHPAAPIFASDIDANFVALAKRNALQARVEKDIHFSESCFFSLEKPCSHGLLITNLPYGERLEVGELTLQEFYQKLGDHLKKAFSGWQAYLLVNEQSPWKFIGLKPKRKYNLVNGSIKTKLLYFELYDGSKKRRTAADTVGDEQ